MSNNSDDDSPKPESSTSDGVVSRSARTLSDYLRTISSGASTVARTAASAASSVVNRPSLRDQVLWAGFDKLEKEDGDTRKVLLLAFHSGFQIWDVEDTENVHVIVSAHDGHAAFMQMLPYPLVSQDTDDIFSASRPLLAVCGDSSWVEILDIDETASEDIESETVVPTHVNVYSLKSNSYVHTLKFQSVIYTIRCSSRIVAVLQADQIHCFDAKTLAQECSIVTNSIAYGSLGVGYGPLAVGPRWIAYSGSRIADSNSTIFTSELLSLSSSPSVSQFARESSKHIVSGIARLGGKGYKSLSRICTETLPLPNPYIPGFKGIGVTSTDKAQDAESVGMVIISDVTDKSLICQFKAHKNPISALSFDPSGMLLVSASTQGNNIHVFKITPRTSNTSDPSKESFRHLFKLHRGYTYAVIQGISFSNDSSVIVVSSSRGTSHLFEINPEGEGHIPVLLSPVIKIRSRDIGGWMGTVSGAAAAAMGTVSGVAAAAAGMVVGGGGGGGDSLPGSTTTTFCGSDNSFTTRNLLVFAPSGCMTQFALKAGGDGDEALVVTGTDSESGAETEGPVVRVRRWSMIQNRSRREMQAQHSDIYGPSSSSESNLVSKQSGEEPWKASKKGKAILVEGNHQLYVSETELRMYQPPQLASWECENIRFQKLVLDGDEEDNGGGGGGEMAIERIQAQTIEARTTILRPVWG
ncbi:BCAS3 domain-containing protein [Hirschfeldia incana]|nr:BCAS3 domain-containing protein [Hirschfeldia incana]